MEETRMLFEKIENSNFHIILFCILGITIFILGYMLKKLIKENHFLNRCLNSSEDILQRQNANLTKKEVEQNALQLSITNADNLHKFLNNLYYMRTHCHQRYHKIYQKKLLDRQIAYVVFYENSYTYQLDYLDNKDVNFDISKHVARFDLSCRMFIDGEEIDPSLNTPILSHSDTIKIQELNLHKHEGKGAGSFYLQSLSKELLRYPQIKRIYGDLSDVDYPKKDKLLHFYSKNGFENIVPMTPNAFGHISKKLKVIENDALRLTFNDMTFGIEIEFQLRNDYSPLEIAKELFTLGLSNCNEVKTYNTIDEITGWKIIREKTCDYEIISPILTDCKKCWAELNLVCCLLAKHGAYTDQQCAFHIHIGTQNLLIEGKQWTSLMASYRKLEPFFYAVSKGDFEEVSKTRQRYYAISMAMADKQWSKGWSIEECLQQIENGRLDLVSGFYHTRNIGMNWRCMSEPGKTIEFRTFNGSIDFFTIQSYLMFTCNFVDKIALGKDINIPINTIMKERSITESTINTVIEYLSDDSYIKFRLKQFINKNILLDDFTWDMLNGIGEVHVS